MQYKPVHKILLKKPNTSQGFCPFHHRIDGHINFAANILGRFENSFSRLTEDFKFNAKLLAALDVLEQFC